MFAERVIAATVAVVFVALCAATALTKAPWTDELFYSTPALDLISRGSLGVPIMEPTGCVSLPGGTVNAGINHHVYYISVAHFVISATFYKVVGFTILTVRLYSILCGLVFLAAWYLILRKLSGEYWIAMLGTALLAVNHVVVNSAADGRPDMACAAIGTAGLAAFLWLRERHLGLAILASHTLVALAAAVHQTAILYLIAVLLTTIYFDWRRLRIHYLAVAAIPYLGVFGAWAAYVLSDKETAFAQTKVMFGHRIGHSFGIHEWLWREIMERYLSIYLSGDTVGIARLKVLPALFYPLGVAGAALTAEVRNQRSYRLLLLIALIDFGVLSVMDGSKMPYYLIHTLPLFCVLFGIWIAALWKSGGVRRQIAGTLGIVFALVNISWTGYSARRNPYLREFMAAAHAAREHTGPKSMINGPLQMGLVFGFYNNLMDDATLGYYTGRGADVIIIDEQGYGEAFRAYSKSSPALYEHIRNLLTNQYALVYQNRSYKVYSRKGDPPAPA